MAMDESLVAAELLDERAEFTLREVVRLCRIGPDQVVELVAEGIVAPQGEAPLEWRFSGTSVVRIQTALRLEQDLGVNRAGAALVLDLLEDLRELERRLQRQTEGTEHVG
jgi:chaperone modulatory protein CbpM